MLYEKCSIMETGVSRSLFVSMWHKSSYATEVGDLVPDVRGNALQQDGRRVTCTISDKAGPIVGANVLIKGTTIEIFRYDGRVILDGVPDNTILVVSYIGYVTQEISLKNSQNNIKVKLAEDTQALDEVVVVGYGTQAKKDITGSVAVVSTEELKETPVATFSEACKERLPVCISRTRVDLVVRRLSVSVVSAR